MENRMSLRNELHESNTENTKVTLISATNFSLQVGHRNFKKVPQKVFYYLAAGGITRHFGI